MARSRPNCYSGWSIKLKQKIHVLRFIDKGVINHKFVTSCLLFIRSNKHIIYYISFKDFCSLWNLLKKTRKWLVELVSPLTKIAEPMQNEQQSEASIRVVPYYPYPSGSPLEPLKKSLYVRTASSSAANPNFSWPDWDWWESGRGVKSFIAGSGLICVLRFWASVKNLQS